MTVLLDDHLLRDVLARPDTELLRVIDGDVVATTNLAYARLCKSAAAEAEVGALLGGWSVEERRQLVAALVALPESIVVRPMRDLSWRMGELAAQHRGLSTLGRELVAAALVLPARVAVSSRDVSPGVQACCESLGVRFEIVQR